jgi:hypothetical protein
LSASDDVEKHALGRRGRHQRTVAAPLPLAVGVQYTLFGYNTPPVLYPNVQRCTPTESAVALMVYSRRVPSLYAHRLWN